MKNLEWSDQEAEADIKGYTWKKNIQEQLQETLKTKKIQYY
jgi:hypothetical protein